MLIEPGTLLKTTKELTAWDQEDKDQEVPEGYIALFLEYEWKKRFSEADFIIWCLFDSKKVYFRFYGFCNSEETAQENSTKHAQDCLEVIKE